MSCTPLIKAAVENNFAEFVDLIGKGANVNEGDALGAAPIHLAMMHQDEKIARFIMSLPKFDINIQRKKSGQTPLMYAIAFQRIELARDLLSREGVNTLLKDVNGHDIHDYLKAKSLTLDGLLSSAKKLGGVAASASASSSTPVDSQFTSLDNLLLKEKVRESKESI